MVHLTVSYSAVIGNVLPLWAAQDAGIFKKNGLDVNIRYIHSSDGIPALIAGDIQAADIGGPETVSAVANGSELVTVADDAPTFPFVLMAPADIKTIQDLKGKKIGVSEPGSASDIATRLALEKAGLNPDKDVTILPVGSASTRISALENGSIQAGLSFPPNTAMLEQKGFHIVYDLAKEKVPGATSTQDFTRSYVQAHPDVVQKYVDSLVEAIAWARQNKAEAVKVLEKYTKNNNTQQMDGAYDFFMNEVIPALPYPEASQYTPWIPILAQRNSKAANFDPSKMLDSSFVKKAADQHLDQYPLPSGASVSTAGSSASTSPAAPASPAASASASG